MPAPGTTGTEKTFQQETVRTAGLEMRSKLNTSTPSSSTAGSCTLNAAAGVITTETLSTAGATEYVLTLTNSFVSASDISFACAANGTNTQSPGGSIATVTPGAGFMTIRILNESATAALNGTLAISFFTIKSPTTWQL